MKKQMIQFSDATMFKISKTLWIRVPKKGTEDTYSSPITVMQKIRKSFIYFSLLENLFGYIPESKNDIMDNIGSSTLSITEWQRLLELNEEYACMSKFANIMRGGKAGGKKLRESLGDAVVKKILPKLNVQIAERLAPNELVAIDGQNGKKTTTTYRG